MTFKGMLKIVMTDYRKQHEEKMFSVVDELIKTRRELKDVKEQLRILQLGGTSPPSDVSNRPVPTISLFVQYNGFFNQLCAIRQTMTIRELLMKLREITGISFDRPIRLRVLSEDGLETLFFLHKSLDRTLASYDDCLKARMILSIEDGTDDSNDERTTKRKTFQRSNTYSNEQPSSYESAV